MSVSPGPAGARPAGAPARASLVFAYRAHNATALNVLLGALEESDAGTRVAARVARGREELVAVLGEEIARRERVLVLWSFYSPESSRCVRDLSWVRRRARAGKVAHAAGGPHASAEPRATLEAGFDLAALGEGEGTILALARALSDGGDLREAPGVASLRDGAYRSNGPGARSELDQFPPFAAASGRLNPIEITRGCVYACQFCQTPFLFKARFRHRSVENVARHVRAMRSLGADFVRFISPTSLSYGSDGTEPRLDRVEALLASVRAELGPRGRLYFGTFPSEVRPEHVTPAALDVLRRHVSNRALAIGGQSGSERVLEASRRGHGVEVIRAAVRHAREAGFLPHIDFVFGLPGEEAEDTAASLALAEELAAAGARIHAHTFMPLPGTPTRDAPPGRLTATETLRLERLLARGAVHGQWKHQRSVARRLAAARARRAEKAEGNGARDARIGRPATP